MYENFVGTLETVHNREVCVLRDSTVPSIWWYLCLEMRLIKGILAWKQGCLGNTRLIILISWRIKNGAFMAIRRWNGKNLPNILLVRCDLLFEKYLQEKTSVYILKSCQQKGQSFEKSQGRWDLQVKFIVYIYIRLAFVRQLTPASLQGLHAIVNADLGGCYPP